MKEYIRKISIILFLILVVGKLPLLSADVIVPLSDSSSNAQHPAIATTPGGISYVAWQQQISGNWEIILCRITSDGFFDEQFDRINVSETSGSSILPDVSVDSDGNSYIVWQESDDIYFSIVSAAGEKMVDKKVVRTFACSNPAISCTMDGLCNIVFEQQNGTFYRIRYSQLDNNGNTLADSILITDNIVFVDRDLSISTNRHVGSWYGTSYILYRDIDYFFNYGIYITELKQDGSIGQYDGLKIINGDYATHPHVALSPERTYIYLQNKIGSLYGIYSYNGGSLAKINQGGGNAQKPCADADGNDTVYMGWQDNRNGNWDVYVSRLDLDGEQAGEEICISDGASESQEPDLTVVDGSWHLVWQDDRDGQWRIYFVSRKEIGLKQGDYVLRRLSQTKYNVNSQDYDNDWHNEPEDEVKNSNLITHALYPFQHGSMTGDVTGYKWSGFNTITPNGAGNVNGDNREPLILIHGWQAHTDGTDYFMDRDPAQLAKRPSENHYDAEGYWWSFLRYFEATPELKEKFKVYLYQYPSYKHVTFNARMLSNMLYDVKYIQDWINNGSRITFLVHSMGGLVARSLLEQHGGIFYNASATGEDWQLFKSSEDFLNKLITLDTPHQGSPAAVYPWVDAGGIICATHKDVFTPGSMDLWWTGYDYAFERLDENDLDECPGGPPEDAIANRSNSWRNDGITAFDEYYRSLLNEDQKGSKEIYCCCRTSFVEFYYYPNPWLTYLNNLHSQNSVTWQNRYIFYGGYNDNSNKPWHWANRLEDKGKIGAADNTLMTGVWEAGYLNDAPVPVTSCFFDTQTDLNSEEHDGWPDEDQVGMFWNFVWNEDKNIHISTNLGYRIRFFRDYHHDRMLNGAYYHAGDEGPGWYDEHNDDAWNWDLITNEELVGPKDNCIWPLTCWRKRVFTGFKNTEFRQSYIAEAGGLSWPPERLEVSDSDTSGDADWINNLQYEPLFLLLKQDLLGQEPDQQPGLRVNINPSDAGSVVSPEGIDCPDNCYQDYDDATQITLTSAPNFGFSFYGWRGAYMGAEQQIVVTIQGKTFVTACFGEIGTSQDSDGVDDLEELGPGGDDPSYDGDDNGIADYQDDRAASLFTAAGQHYITIASATGSSLTAVSTSAWLAEQKKGALDSEDITSDTFPYDLLHYTVIGVEAGSSTTVTLFFQETTMGMTYFQYGPTPDNPEPHWYDFNYDGQTGAVFNGNRIILHYVDGMRGDNDFVADGTITVTGGPSSESYGFCTADIDHDGDVDGGDLAQLAAGFGIHFTLHDLEVIARDFGKMDCP